MFRIILVYTACVLALVLGLGFLMKSTAESFQDAPPLTTEQLSIINNAIDAKTNEISSALEKKVNTINKTIDDKNNELASWAVTALA